MPRYKKKPVVIEAFRLGIDEIPGWFTDAYPNHDLVNTKHLRGITISTWEGDMHARIGDWIIQGIMGEIYPCRDDVFQATYTQVGEEDA